MTVEKLQPTASKVLLPTVRLRQRYGVTDRTLSRWLVSADLNFPKPIIINRRRYWREADLALWEIERAKLGPRSEKYGTFEGASR